MLVDSSSNPLPNQQLIAGTGDFNQGATFNILLSVPSANGLTQTIKAQTQMVAKGKATVVSIATNSGTLTTVKDVGIAEMLPSAVYLTSANPEQIITFSNIGNAMAQLWGLVSNNPNIEIVFNPTNLNTGLTAMITIRLKDTSIAKTQQVIGLCGYMLATTWRKSNHLGNTHSKFEYFVKRLKMK